jgi:hypothetical protein
MIRYAVLALCAAACGRSQGVADQELPGLVTEVRKADPPVDVELAAHDPAELGRALARPYRSMAGELGPHSAAVNTSTTVEQAGVPVSELSDHAQIESGEAGAYHAVYTNSADYGRETTFLDGKLYLRPRYQRWHGRAPETPDEPLALRDQYFEAISAVWDLLAPGIEISDAGATEIAGRAARKITVRRSSDPSKPPAEPIAQRKWREARSVEAVEGEIALDAAKGVPLAIKLAGTVGFSRDGRRFTMKVSLDSTVSGLGAPAAIAAPAADDVVATPERLREVDDRDYLLQGIAPPLRKNPDGTAVPPAPAGSAASPTKPPAGAPARRARSDGGKP